MRTFALLVLAAAATGCVRTSTNPATGKMDVDVESPTKKGEDWKSNLTGTGMYANVRGNSVVLVAEGRSNVTIAIEGVQPGAVHPWHVHAGVCGSSGPIVGDPGAYTPITVGNDGIGRASAAVALRLEESAKYHVNVHLSPSQMETIIACGNLED